ncbi:MAG: nucleotide exchange factor GrpE [Muribaculaceae bacterium]|nr:nucleotide exchange factor GrpE [Muribaculaceae bacterium]
MSKDNKKQDIENYSPEIQDEAPDTQTVADNIDDTVEELSEEEKLQNNLAEALAEVEKEKKEYLFLMAEFDNYRKRVTREKADLLKNAAERVLLGLLPIVDDFERGLAATADSADNGTIREGMELIYNKFIKYLESNGVKEMQSTGAAFDADIHEAIATIPAPNEDLKGMIIDTTQKGYMLNDKVLRHAKVVVGE